MWLWVVVCVLAFVFFSYRAYQGLVVKETRAFRTGRVLLGEEAKADGGASVLFALGAGVCGGLGIRFLKSDAGED